MKHRSFLAIFFLLALTGRLQAATPLGTIFTYQGVLNQGAATAPDGFYDFSFAAYDAETGGTQVGWIWNVPALPVTNGLFTTTLNLGSIYDGNQRWLAIAVKTNAATTYAELAPRQPLTPGPYALFAPNAGTAANLSGTLDGLQIVDGSITTAKLANASVTSAKIEAAAVGTSKIAVGAVSSPAILDGSITTVDLADNSVTSAKIVDGAVGTLDLADGSVTSVKIEAAAVGTSKIAVGAVSSPAILDGSITTADLADNSVTSAKIVDGAVGTLDLADGSVTSVKIAAAAVGTSKIAVGAVSSPAILDGSIATADLADNSITSAKIADASVTSAKILDGTIATADLADGSVTSAKILDGTIATADLANLAVSTAKLADSSVTSAKIVDGTIATADLADNSVAAGKLANDWGSLTKVTSAGMVISGGVLDMNIDTFLNDHEIYLRGDGNHGLGWYGAGKLYAGIDLNGPALYGNGGGALGWRNAGVDHPVLSWNTSDRVGIGTTTPTAKLDVDGDARVRGLLRSGSESGTSEAPSPAGLVVRRINSVTSTSGQVVALATAYNSAAGSIALIRDGTAGGFQIRIPANANSSTVVACMGIDSAGVQRNFYTTYGSTTTGTFQIYANATGIVHFECTFGDTYHQGAHLTQVTLSRFGTDSYWSGTLMSTSNQ